MNLDYDRVIEGWNGKAKWIASQLQGIPGLTAEYAVYTMGYGDVDLSWDQKTIPLSEEEVKEKLIAVERRRAYDDGTTVRTRRLRGGEEVLVARRLRELFEKEGA